MKRKLKELEIISRQLEPNVGQRKATRKQVISYTENFLEQIEKIIILEK
jgi:hypothetical protein